MRSFTKSLSFAVSISIFLTMFTSVPAPGKWKSSIGEAAYARWSTIEAPLISPDGKWVAYTVRAAQGEDTIVVQQTHGNTEYRVSRGMRTQPGLGQIRQTGFTRFSDDSKFIVFASESALQDHALAKGGSANVNARLIRIQFMRISDGHIDAFLALSGTLMVGGEYVAYLRNSHVSNGQGGSTEASLVLRHLPSGKDFHVDDVASYVFDNNSQYIAYVVRAQMSSRDGVYVHRLATGETANVLRGPDDYSCLTFDSAGRQLAFLGNRKQHALSASQARGSMYLPSMLYFADSPMRPARAVSLPSAAKSETSPRATCDLRFSSRGDALLLKTTYGLHTKSAAGHVRDGKTRFELLHWRYATPIPQASWHDAKPNTLTSLIYHIAHKRWAQLGDEMLDEVIVSDDARHAVGLLVNQRDQRNDSRPIVDLYRIDVDSGERTLLRAGLSLRRAWRPHGALVTISPGGHYLIYFEKDRWISYRFETETFVDLTGQLLPRVRFESDRTDDSLTPQGIAGWTAQDSRVLIYAHRDIWLFDPSGNTAAQNITGGIGQRENIVFRLWSDYGTALDHPAGHSRVLPREGQFIATDRSFLLIALDKDTMQSGVWQAQLHKPGLPKKLLMLDKRITPIAKAAGAEQYLVTLETYSEYPDLWIGSSFGSLRKISAANPQQSEYSWGSVKLVDFTSNFGTPLKGRLYTPESFDTSKPHPMIVSIYETRSTALHQYRVPWPLEDANIENAVPTFVSQGYVVFIPDIDSAAPHPGQSAFAAVLPAVQTVIELGGIDSERLALSGHSFGGYETAYIVAQTASFRCAVLGAAPLNTLSNYIANPEVFEQGQMRHRYPPWQRPLTYLENSPLFFVNSIASPLLFLHNEDDPLVSFDQAEEFMLALRRNRKEAYLFNYKDENHFLQKYENRLDWDARVHQFIDFHLKGAPVPSWLEPLPSTDDDLRHLSSIVK